MSPNDPSINRKYNYVYRITNTSNGMEYIGVHRTDNIDDGYMGSGMILKRAIAKYGLERFHKAILSSHDTYMAALEEERRLVTLKYINENNTYNIREGGFGRCSWSDKQRQLFSEQKRKQWGDTKWREQMVEKIFTPERAAKISKALMGRPRLNLHNTDPGKIRKTAETHTGMVRSAKAKKNMSLAAINASKEVKLRRSGRGMVYIHNPQTMEMKRQLSSDIIPEGWLSGSGPKNSDKYIGMNEGSYFGHHPITLQCKRFQRNAPLLEGWVRGRATKK